MRCGHADIGVARRGRIDESGAKARANGGHKIARVGAAKTTVHALPLLQRVIGHGEPHIKGSPQPAAKERKLITMAGSGVTADPLKLIALRGKVPAMLLSASSTNKPLT